MTGSCELLQQDRIHRPPACGRQSRQEEVGFPSRVLAEGPSSPPLRSQQPLAPFSNARPLPPEYGGSSHYHPPPGPIRQRVGAHQRVPTVAQFLLARLEL